LSTLESTCDDAMLLVVEYDRLEVKPWNTYVGVDDPGPMRSFM